MARSTGQPPGKVLAIALVAFLGFRSIDSLSNSVGRLKNQKTATRRTLGLISGGLLLLHSFRDGRVSAKFFSQNVIVPSKRFLLPVFTCALLLLADCGSGNQAHASSIREFRGWKFEWDVCLFS